MTRGSRRLSNIRYDESRKASIRILKNWQPHDIAQRIATVTTMTKSKNSLGFAPFDAAEYLKDDSTIAEFLSAALEDDNPDVFLRAVHTAVRARDITKLAGDARAVLRDSHNLR